MLVYADNFGLMSPYSASMQPTPTSLAQGGASASATIGDERIVNSGGIPFYILNIESNDDAPVVDNGTGAVHSLDYNMALLLRGAGRMSENAIGFRPYYDNWGSGRAVRNYNWGSSPVIPDTKRVIVGMWIGPVVPGFSTYGEHSSSFDALCFNTAYPGCRVPFDTLKADANGFSFTFASFAPFLGQTILDKVYTSNVRDNAGAYSTSDAMPRHIRVTFRYLGSSAWIVELFRYSNTGYVYPAIPPSPVFYADASRPFFLEVFVDANDAQFNGGLVKCAINGSTVASFNVCPLDSQRLGGDYSKHDAYFGQVFFGFFNDWTAILACSLWQIDGYYICDGSAGYQDDFLGPVQITNVFPDGEDSGSWTTVLNGAHGEFDHGDCVKLPYYCRRTFDETSYLEADQHGMREIMRFEFPFDELRTSVKAVQLSTIVEKQHTFSVTPSPRVYSTVRISGHDAVDLANFTYLHTNEQHRCSIAPMSVAPALATPWTWDLLRNAQFGFTYYDTVNVDITCSISASGVTGDPQALFDGVTTTSVSCYNGYIDLIIPDGQVVEGFELHVHSASESELRYYIYTSVDDGMVWRRAETALKSIRLDPAYPTGGNGVSLCKFVLDWPLPVTRIRLSRCTFHNARIIGTRKA